MTATDYLAAFVVAFLLGLVFTLVIREHRREVGVRDALLVADMRANPTATDIAADMLARQKRQDELDAWTRATRVEFEKAMQGRPFLAAIRAESEAADLDDEWKRIQQNGWAS